MKVNKDTEIKNAKQAKARKKTKSRNAHNSRSRAAGEEGRGLGRGFSPVGCNSKVFMGNKRPRRGQRTPQHPSPRRYARALKA